MNRPLTAEDPEYWGLASIVTDEMADVALKMKVRKPMTLPEIVKATGKTAEELEPLLYKMSCVGLLEYNWENPRREKQYVLPMFVPGSAEFFNMNKQQIAEHPEVTAFFERMTFLPLEHITAMVPPGGAGIGMHVIPVEKAIETENQSLDIEHISHWLKKYEGKYAARALFLPDVAAQAMGEGCGDDPDDWCIGVGDMADYLVETHKGHYITYDEVMQILQKAEDNGFVHQITNIDGENKIFAICNCNVNVCNALRTSQLFNTPNMSRSRLCGQGGKGKLRGLWALRGVLPRRCGEAGPKAVHQGRADRLPAAGIARRRQVGPGEVGHRLPRQEPHQLLRHRHGPLQDGLPRPHCGAGLPEDGRPGPLPRRAGADQEGEPIPRRVRAHLQPPVRGCLYPRHHRPGRGH